MGIPKIVRGQEDRFVILDALDHQTQMQMAINAMMSAPPGTFGLVGVDSLSALVGRAALEGGTASSWSLASWLSPTIPLLTAAIVYQGACALFTQQVREVKDDKTGVVSELTNGGNAIKHAATVRTFHRVVGEKVIDTGQVVSRTVEVTAVKGPQAGVRTRVVIHNPGYHAPTTVDGGDQPAAGSILDEDRRRFVQLAPNLVGAGLEFNGNGHGGGQ